MKKSLVALACLPAFAGVAQAASVQVYGRLDAGLTSISGVGSSDETLTGLAYGPLSSSRWGIKGKDSYLYNSVKLYRQTKLGDWEKVLRQIRDDL